MTRPWPTRRAPRWKFGRRQGLKTEGLLTKVLTDVNSDVRKTQWFNQFNGDIAKAKADFEKNLSVSPLQDTKLVRVEFTYSKPDDCKTIVQNLVATHLEQQKQFQIDTLADRTTILNNVRIKAEMRKKELDAEMREKQIRLNTDGGTVGMGKVGVKEMELSKLVGEQVEAQIMMGKAKSIFDSIYGAVSQGQDPPGIDRYMSEFFPSMQQEKYQLSQFEIELAIAGESPEGTRYKALKKRYDLTKKAFDQQVDEARRRRRSRCSRRSRRRTRARRRSTTA